MTHRLPTADSATATATATTELTDMTRTAWPDKHRPKTLDEVALKRRTRRLLEAWIEDGDIPHLLFHGPPGTGKTTTTLILADRLPASVHSFGAEDKAGVEFVRDTLAGLARRSMPRSDGISLADVGTADAEFRLIILNECERLSNEAQAALRDLIEDPPVPDATGPQAHRGAARFLLVTNDVDRVQRPIQSRCKQLDFPYPPADERKRVLRRVLDVEGVAYQADEIHDHAAAHEDMRELLREAQDAVRLWGGLSDVRLTFPAGAAPDVDVVRTVRAVARLASNGRASKAKVADALDVSPPKADALLQRAEDAGWITDDAGPDEQGYRYLLTPRVEARHGG